MVIELHAPVEGFPDRLGSYDLRITDDPCTLVYRYDKSAARTGITTLLSDLAGAGLVLRDVQTRQSSLEDIFVQLVQETAA